MHAKECCDQGVWVLVHMVHIVLKYDLKTFELSLWNGLHHISFVLGEVE